MHDTSTEAELIESFQNLITNTSGNSDILQTYSNILEKEIERISNKGSDTEEDKLAEEPTTPNIVPDDGNLQKLVSQSTMYLSPKFIEDNTVKAELEEIYKPKHWNSKYVWLTNTSTPYKFGGKTYEPIPMENYSKISQIKNRLNRDFGYNFDSCLLIRYTSHAQQLTLHQDNEDILDRSQPICCITIGCTRKLQFWDSGTEATGSLIKEVTMDEGTLVTMWPGCQTKLWHKVPRNDKKENGDNTRYALSFRKVQPSTPLDTSLSTSPPEVKTTVTDSMVYQPPQNTSTPRPAFHSPVIKNEMGISENASQKTPEPQLPKNNVKRHLVIGDSMTIGLNVPDSVVISKGGIHPYEVSKLLQDSHDLLHPDDYEKIRSVTLVVGTNALNVTSPGEGIPLLDIVFDYEALVNKLINFFPNARLGLFNVLPRAYVCRETFFRIETFNKIFEQHVVNHYPNVHWIRHYWEFVDSYGYLKRDLYGRKGLHLSFRGKMVMSEVIKNFQNSYL